LVIIPGDSLMGKFHTSPAWKRLRILKLARDPLCQLCLMRQVTTPASEVHHTLSVEDYPEEALNMMYLQSLCSECHDQISGREGDRGSNLHR